MAHTQNREERMLNRVRRIRGQVEAIERALEEKRGCADVLCLIAASRGAMNSLMAEVVEQHVRENVLEAANDRARLNAADELIEVVSTYLR
jgi:DNA-binding FrmR family transcriptional regulator